MTTRARNLARLVVSGTGAIDATNLTNAVPADGSITEAKLANDSVTAAKIATNAVGADELAATGVTAGTYGSGSAIPAVTVDADGRITSIATNPVAGGVSSLNGQTGAINNTDYNTIGSYVVAFDTTFNIYGTTATRLPNTTIAGSSLARTTGTGVVDVGGIYSSGTGFTGLGLSGTWRRMSGLYGGNYDSTAYGSALYVRIS